MSAAATPAAAAAAGDGSELLLLLLLLEVEQSVPTATVVDDAARCFASAANRCLHSTS
jgi:hypothetical protein